MSFSLIETPESRAQQYGTASTDQITRIYKVVGEQDDVTVRNYIEANTSATLEGLTGTLYRKQIDIQPDGWQQYVATITYGGLELRTLQTGSYTFNFDTTGGTTNIKAGKAHVNSYPAGAPNHQGAIGVKQDGTVDGCDIIVPKLKITFAFKYSSGIITAAKIKDIAAITGTTNSKPFLGFAIGELLFLGATGSNGSQQEMEVTFNFEASQNVTGISTGGISGVDKKGHDYLWHEFGDDVHSGKAITKAKYVHVERVYDSADWAAVFNWNIYTG